MIIIKYNTMNDSTKNDGCWPGLVFWIGAGMFRTLGYLFLVFGGISIAQEDVFGLILDLLTGHILICAAEVIDKISELNTTP